VVAILAALLLPALAAGKKKAQRINCANNLRQTGFAFRIWAQDHDDKYPMDLDGEKGGTKGLGTGADTYRHFQVLSNESGSPKILICPADMREAASSFARLNNRNVSYFVGLEANGDNPRMILDGDRNITGPNPPENGVLALVPGQTAGWTREIHVNSGNVGLVDCSVVQCTESSVSDLLKKSGPATNTWHLLLPE
jgi:hypothetical protein